MTLAFRMSYCRNSPHDTLNEGETCFVQEAHEPAEARKTLGAQQMEELAENSGAPAKAKGPRRSKVEKKAVVEIPAIINDKTPFVPPAAFLKR
jgi:hypothetical protein